jgi:hypothetical protein
MEFAPAETLFDEILEFLAASPSAEAIVSYQPPVALQQRLSVLLDRNRSSGLSESDQKELEEFLRMNRLMSRLKLKARKHLKS